MRIMCEVKKQIMKYIWYSLQITLRLRGATPTNQQPLQSCGFSREIRWHSGLELVMNFYAQLKVATLNYISIHIWKYSICGFWRLWYQDRQKTKILWTNSHLTHFIRYTIFLDSSCIYLPFWRNVEFWTRYVSKDRRNTKNVNELWVFCSDIALTDSGIIITSKDSFYFYTWCSRKDQPA